MTICTRLSKLTKWAMQYVQFSNDWALEVPSLMNALGKHQKLIDTKADELRLLADDYLEFKEWLILEHATGINKEADSIANRRITSDISTSVRKLASLSEDKYNALLKGEGTLAGFMASTPIAEYGSAKVDQLSEFIINMNKTFGDADYNLQKIMQYLNQGDVFQSVLSDLHGSLRIDIADYFKVNQQFKAFSELRDNFSEALRGEMLSKGITPTEGQFTRLVDDMAGESLLPKTSRWIVNLLSETRSLLTPLKYTVGVVPGAIMVMNSAIIGTVTYKARKSMAMAATDGDLVRHLLEEELFIKAESKSAHLDLRLYSGLGDTFVNRFIDMMLKKDSILSGLVKGGWHQLWDVSTDVIVKKQSVSLALSKAGIYGKQAEAKFLTLVKNWEISDSLMTQLRADTLKFYKDYGTNANNLMLSRSKFARGGWILINTLQSYMFSKSGQVFSALNNFARDIDAGKLRTWEDAINYIFNDTNNIELSHMIMSVIQSAKLANYVSISTDDSIPDKEKNNAYILATNDYLSSMDANFFGRMFNGFMDNEEAYLTYINDKWEKWQVNEAASVGAYGILAQVVPAILKEFSVLNPAIFGTYGFITEEGSLINKISFGTDIAASEINKIASGLGRFTLLPGLENYGQRKVPQTDDWFATLALAIQSTNKSMNIAQQLRNLDTVTKVIENGVVAEGMALMQNLPMVKWLLKTDTALQAPLYREWLQSVDDDKVLNDMMNGRYNPEIVNNKNVDTTFKTLTAFDYTRLSPETIKSIDSEMSTFGINKEKSNAFMILLAEKMGDAELKASILSKAPNVEQMNLQKILNFANEQVPGSARVVMSYVANNMMGNMTDEYNISQTGKKYGRLPDDVYTAAQKVIVDKLYPNMYVADKESWYQLMSDRMVELHPKKFKKSTELNTFLNTLQYLDVVSFAEAQTGDVNSMYMKNAFNIAGKYAPTDLSKMMLFEHAVSGIDSMQASKDTKNAMLMGVISGNLNTLDKILGNKDFVESHKDAVTRTLDLTFGKLNGLAKYGSDLVIGDMAKGSGTGAYPQKARFQYSAATGRPFTPSKFASGNAAVGDELSRQVGNLYKKLPEGYTPGAAKNIDFPYNPYRRFELPPTNAANAYFSIKGESPTKAETINPVHGYVNRFAGDSYKQVMTNNKYKAAKFIPVSKIKIPKVKIGIRWKTFDY